MIEQSLFAVKEVPAGFTLSKETNEISGYLPDNTGHKFIVREDNGDVLSCVTNDYKLVTNQEVMDKALPIIEKNKGTLDEVKTFSQGARTNWTFRFHKNPIKIDGENIYPQMNIKNSYDGSTQVNVLGGAFRLVCSNGLVVGRILGKKSERHSIWNPKLQNGHIGNIVQETIDQMETVLNNEFPKLISSKVRQKDIVNILQRFPTTQIEHLSNYLAANKTETYWDLFNAATWVLSHVSNRNHETTHKLESEMFQVIKKMAEA